MQDAITGHHPLSWLCFRDHPNNIAIAERLIAHGTTIDLESSTTALNNACANGVVPMVEWLLEHGASIHDPFNAGHTALERSTDKTSYLLGQAARAETEIARLLRQVARAEEEEEELDEDVDYYHVRELDKMAEYQPDLVKILNIMKILIERDPNVDVDALRVDPEAKEIVQKEIDAYKISLIGRFTKVALHKPFAQMLDPDDDDATTDVDSGLVGSAASQTVALDDLWAAMERDAPRVEEAPFAAAPEPEQHAAVQASNTTPLLDLLGIDFLNFHSDSE